MEALGPGSWVPQPKFMGQEDPQAFMSEAP